MKRKKKTVFVHPDKEWDNWKEASCVYDGTGQEHKVPPDCRYMMNNHYQVLIQSVSCPLPFGTVIWLSIKRNDRKAIHDWRDLQQIKNELVGPEIEAVELYPSESRLVDTSNQYHLWCFMNHFKMPFGYQERLVMGPEGSSDPMVSRARQRPFRGHQRPSDVKTSEEAQALLDDFKRNLVTTASPDSD